MKALKSSRSPAKSSPKKRQQSGSQQTTVPIKRPKLHLVEESPEKASPSALPWVEKYKPTSLKQLIGQQTDKSPTNKLLDWLKNWARYHLTIPTPGDVKKKARPNPFSAQSDGSTFKAALVSGPPGIGKTSAAIMCCRELGLAFVEMNASDVRNKSGIEKRAEQLTSNQLEKYYKPTGAASDENSAGPIAVAPHNISSKKSPGKRNAKGQEMKAKQSHRKIEHVLIMDEVDGMSGNADRAGIAELIQMIKRTRVPIICICNDRQSRKIRSLANYCFDLRFQRPRAEQIKGRLMTIISRERITIPKESIDRIIEASNQDIRQCINSLQLIASGTSTTKQIIKKDITVNIFEAARQILSADTQLLTKAELYFMDYSMMPLFVQENYPNVRSSGMSNLDHIGAIRTASDLIAFGDIVSRQIRSQGVWSLMNDHAMFSCAMPASVMDGYMTAQIQFPAWFGKNSNAQKRQRLMRQLALHTHLKITGSNQALVQDYLPLFRERLYRPLVRHEGAGVKEVLSFYNNYCLLREDTDAINELGLWPLPGGKQRDLAAMVSTKAKSALTRQLNKEKRLLPFSQPTQVKAGRRKAAGKPVGTEMEVDEEGREMEVDEDEEEDEGEQNMAF